MKQNLYFYLIKLGVHIGHSKIDWNPTLNTLMAGMTKSNYLIFNINKSVFFLKRTLLFYKLLGYNNGSFIIYYMGTLSNYTDALEGYLDKEGLIPNSYPFLYNIIKPGFFSNWKTNYKYLIKSFYKIIFHNQYFFISLINKVANDHFNKSKLKYKHIGSFGAKLRKISDYYITRKIYKMYFPFLYRKKIIKLVKKNRNLQYLNVNDLSKFANKTKGHYVFRKRASIRPKLELAVLYNRKQLGNLINLSASINKKKKTKLFSFLLKQLFLYYRKSELILKHEHLKAKNTKNPLKIKKQYTDLAKMISYLNSKLKSFHRFNQRIKYELNKNINHYLTLKKKKEKKKTSDELLSQSFKMFYYNIYSLFLNVFFRRVRFKSNNLSLTPNEYKFFLRFLKFILVFRYLKRIKKIPNSILLLNPELNPSQLTDFNFLKITLSGILDSNSNLSNLSYFIPSNDDSIIILLFYIKLVLFSFENGKKNLLLENVINQINTSEYVYNKVKQTYSSDTEFQRTKYDPFYNIEKKYKSMDAYFKSMKSKYYAGELRHVKREPYFKNNLKANLTRLKHKSLLVKLSKVNNKLFTHLSKYPEKLTLIPAYDQKKKRMPLKSNHIQMPRRIKPRNIKLQTNAERTHKLTSNKKNIVNILLKPLAKKPNNTK